MNSLNIQDNFSVGLLKKKKTLTILWCIFLFTSFFKIYEFYPAVCVCVCVCVCVLVCVEFLYLSLRVGRVEMCRQCINRRENISRKVLDTFNNINNILW